MQEQTPGGQLPPTSPQKADKLHQKLHPKHQPWYIVAVLALVIGLGIGGFYINGSDQASRRDSSSDTSQASELSTDLVTKTNTIQTIASPSELEGRIGVIGCSNTRQHATGYGKWSDKDTLWYQDVDTAGGSLANWADIAKGGKAYWQWFEGSVQEKGAEAVWFQLCLREAETSANGITSEQQQNVTTVINHAREIIGSNVDVYISPLNYYVSNDCSAVGPYGVSNAAELSDWAAETGLALRGPDTGPLDHSLLIDDKCHMNEAGMDLVGQQMVSFFDNGTVIIIPPNPNPNPNPDPTPTPDPDPDPTPTPGGELTADFSFAPEQPNVGQTVFFTNQAIDDGLILKWRWIFSDGTVLYEQNPSFVFSQSGSYKVRLQVVDNEGNRDTVTKTITIN